MFNCILIVVIVVFVLFIIIRNRIYFKHIKSAISKEDYNEADLLLFKKYLSFGNLFRTMKYYDFKFEIEFRKGELLKKNFELAYHEIINTKKKLSNKTLIYLSLGAIINNNIDMAIGLINKCENIDSNNDNKELGPLLLMFANKDYEKYLETVCSFPFNDSDWQVIFAFLTSKVLESIGKNNIIDNTSLPKSKYTYLLGDVQ